MEKLSGRELRRSLNWLLELAKCPVCLATLQAATVQCVNGHPICVSCRRDLKACPSCRDPFSNVRPYGFIQQVIQALPHPCRHQECTVFVKTNDDHEKFCNHQQTNCKYCEWKGPARHILSHLEEEHRELLMLMEPLNKSLVRTFNPKEQCSVFIPIFVEGHFFWGEMKNDPRAEKLTAIIHVVPVKGKTYSVFHAYVKLKSKKNSYNANLQLNMDPDVSPYRDNCISIPTSILHKFTNDNKLMYRLYIVKKQWESIEALVKSKLELIKK